MKSFTCKALAVAAAAACGTTAFAGSLAVTKRNFALEAITNATPVTIPNAVLTIGVARTAAQDFTVVVKPNTASSRFNGSCPLPTNAVAGGGAVTVSLKRSGGTECAYEVDVTADSASNAIVLTFANLVFSNHSLATEGTTESVRFNVVELSENARIDNSEDLVNVVAQSYRAVTLVANQDTGTSADVLFNSGNSPLFGFIAQNGDSTTVAEANFIVNVNGSLTNAGGTTFDAKVDVSRITFTVTGDQDGLDVANAAASVNLGGTVVSPTIAGAGNGASATLTFNAAGTAFNSTGNTSVQLRLPTAATKSLGTSRAFGVSAVVDPQLTGVADQTLSGNATWWQWTANAIELRSAFFNNNNAAPAIGRFFFQNVGTQASYEATCQAEAGVTVTYVNRKGNLVNGTTVIPASDICTFSSGNRGSITFTINSSAGKVKGVYQQGTSGGAVTYIPLERPYNNANSTL